MIVFVTEHIYSTYIKRYDICRDKNFLRIRKWYLFVCDLYRFCKHLSKYPAITYKCVKIAGSVVGHKYGRYLVL